MTISTYQSVTGYNNSGTMTDLDPQPASPAGIQFPAEIVAANGYVYTDGSPFIDLVFSAVSPTQRNALCTKLGISQTTRYALNTVAVRLDDSTFGTFNAIARYPKTVKRDAVGFRDFTIRVVLVAQL